MRALSPLCVLVTMALSACAMGSVEGRDGASGDGADTPLAMRDVNDVFTLDAGTCGVASAPCCAGNVCAAGSVCAGGLCLAPLDCGNDGQACCGEDGGGTCAAALVCTAGLCASTTMAMCGGAMQACCTGGACQAGFTCAASQCVSCGHVAEPCCGSACLAGSVCTAGHCAIDADGDGAPAGADCDDANPSVHPGARERCNAVDDDCNGTIDDAPVCGIWSITRGETSWHAFPFDPVHDADPTMRSPHAPAPGVVIRGIFQIEVDAVAYALTDTTYHVLDLATHSWTAHGSRDVLFPEIAGRMLMGAFAVPARAGTGMTDTASLITVAGPYNYAVTPATQAMAFLGSSGPVSWPGDPNAPSTSGWRFLWLDIDNAEHWITTDIHTICSGLAPSATFQRYLALVDSTGGPSGTLHVSDLGYCSRWAPAQSIDSFPPFTQAGAPHPVDIGATFYRNGLWALRPHND